MSTYDSNKRLIEAGSIVTIMDGSCSAPIQGFVVEPESNEEGQEFCVAVFIGPEVKTWSFNRPYCDITEWDRYHAHNLAENNWHFLLENNFWKKCPRVVFFRPEELLVEEHWNIETLTRRIFPDKWHTLFTFPENLSGKSSAYQCFIDDCASIATQIALYNVWGSIYPLHVCDVCFTKVHGILGDDLPAIKKPLHYADGSPVHSAS